MRGLKSDDIMAVLDFIYCGEANVYQENIDAFLALAEDLKFSEEMKLVLVLSKEMLMGDHKKKQNLV